jgi:predicted N-acyltransferase
MRVQAEIIERIADVAAAEWDALEPSANPFLRHAFLDALEASGCVGGDSGWYPRHLLLRDPRGRLAGAVPLYVKTHSWGEFIFDWSWAQSYARAGLEYYPKLLSAIPFTPVTGPRLLAAADAADEVRSALARLMLETAQASDVSGLHVNFTQPEEQATLEEAGFLSRHDCRFLWRNRGYRDFEDFLDGFRSDKRKKVRRERRRVAESGIELRTLRGPEIGTALWRRIFGFSERTFLRHGNAHYLSADFFERVAARMPDSIVVSVAERAGVPIAAAVFFEGGGSLYGRYWGTSEPVDCLHFEACYYQGIDHCIAQGLDSFDPGTQGEHKLARGFEPTLTRSAHWIAHPGFASAVERFLARERAAVAAYIGDAAEHLPFQRAAGT